MTETTVKFTAVQVEQDCPRLLQDLQKRIAAHLDKAGKYQEKAEQHRTSAGQLFAQVKETCDESGFAAFHEKFFPNLGRSRTYELLAIGTGKKSVEEVRASTRERVARYRANQAASVTVTENTKSLQEPDQERRDREECVALYQKVLDAEREQAQWLAEHPRATTGAGAEVPGEATERPARKSRAQRQYEKLLYAWVTFALTFEFHLDQLRELQAKFSDLKDLAGEQAAIVRSICWRIQQHSLKAPAMIFIEHQTTADMDDGQPLPPFLYDDVIWHVVRRLPDQKTLWRRISMQTNAIGYRRGSVVWKSFQRQTQTTEQIAMSNALVKDRLTNMESAAREDAGFEKILKFKKGEYSIQSDPVPLGTEYLAHTTAWTKCWIKFVDGKVAERKVYRVAMGEKPPEREDLDDFDQDAWPEGRDGKPSDPWVFQHLLPLENVGTGEVVIFVTASVGGRIAVAELCNKYVRRAKKTPNCGQPIIKLATAVMPTTKFDKVPRPFFDVDHWDDADDAALIEPSPPTLRGDMDDEIPF